MPLVSVDLLAMPMDHVENASSLISDAGITRYRVNAKIQQVYSADSDEYWYFPEGIYVEQFDSLLRVVGHITADTAYYFKDKDIWHAIGNVVIKNIEERTFETSELFWDRKIPQNTRGAFYSEQLVKVTEPDGTFFWGLGMTADQTLTNVRFYQFQGEFNVEESDESIRQDTVNSNTSGVTTVNRPEIVNTPSPVDRPATISPATVSPATLSPENKILQ